MDIGRRYSRASNGEWMPHRDRLTCGPNKAVIIIALVCGLVSAAYLPFFPGFKFEESKGCRINGVFTRAE
ncbi:hypothetical protein DPMN_190673 [Dreissena polymorpha]|uniref:Uncharacterized protein n=1 Tax=Dreissena polymorpha TaxID=45954 RepID=A0A9D3Y2D5_DREPO|nr:hypothetical protein DPMN_190673 [Dreissena polymorpha]